MRIFGASRHHVEQTNHFAVSESAETLIWLEPDRAMMTWRPVITHRYFPSFDSIHLLRCPARGCHCLVRTCLGNWRFRRRGLQEFECNFAWGRGRLCERHIRGDHARAARHSARFAKSLHRSPHRVRRGSCANSRLRCHRNRRLAGALRLRRARALLQSHRPTSQ